MRDRIHKFLLKPIVVISAILLSSVLTFFTGGMGYFFGLLVALMFLWSGRFNWSDFGIGKPKLKRTIPVALLLAVALFVFMDILIQPFVELKFGAIDLSNLDGIRGNLIGYILFMLFMWVIAAFGEEFLYRGFFMKQLASILGNSNRAWLLSAICISALFGMAHLYQGMSGVITTGLIGFCLSMIFYKNRSNLILPMLVHGFYDMIGITLIYLNKERIFTEWMLELIAR